MDKPVTPACLQDYEHSFFALGIEDNGEKVSRCGNCMTLKYEGEGAQVRFEQPQAV